MTQQKTSSEQMLIARFSPARMASYLTAAGSPREAIKLYRWNVEASAALYEALHIFEIVLRNAIHEEMERWHQAQGRQGSWLTNPPAQLTQRSKDDLVRAQTRAQETLAKKHSRAGTVAPSASEGDIVAQLTLGFWRYMLATRYTHDLWRDALRYAFPELQNQRLRDIETPVIRLHVLRNRIAHLEPVFTRDLNLDLRSMSTAIGYVCPRTQSWFAATRGQSVKSAISTFPLSGTPGPQQAGSAP
ncbi:hypothetical protein [Streptomyces ortus]|uniref:Abi family protein n=1 Tax=Streptomyces ortus TaxID=2867268 RepID=A0ABT3V0C2_9ACTN|nr:hypothetical protein [Streptomyces ortus]MCX4231841.1 hypothetical protein [Streptomyces ortus]